MNTFFLLAISGLWVLVVVGCWLGWQLLRQNGRILLRLDELEQRFEEWESAEPGGSPAVRDNEALGEDSQSLSQNGTEFGEDQGLVTSPAANNGGGSRASRFRNRSLTHSRIKRDGLKAGTSAPSFRLPRLDGGELSLEELRGARALLVFSDPHCGPCNALAPKLEKIHRQNPEVAVVMISRGEPKENRAKVKEHGLTFPVILQSQWEISRLYAMFATPTAYLIDEAGIIQANVAVGMDSILELMKGSVAPA